MLLGLRGCHLASQFWQGAIYGRELLFEQGKDKGEDVVGDDLVSFGGGVGLVGLHHALDAEDAFEQEGKHGHFVFLASSV